MDYVEKILHFRCKNDDSSLYVYLETTIDVIVDEYRNFKFYKSFITKNRSCLLPYRAEDENVCLHIFHTERAVVRKRTYEEMARLSTTTEPYSPVVARSHPLVYFSDITASDGSADSSTSVVQYRSVYREKLFPSLGAFVVHTAPPSVCPPSNTSILDPVYE